MSEQIFLPDPNRPKMMIRLRMGHEQPEIWERLFPELVKNKACCDEVWFSTGIGFPPMEEHQKISSLMADHAEHLREHGIIPSLQVQATLGHGDSISGAVDMDGQTWGKMVGRNGEQCRYINCPRQEGFLKYVDTFCRLYAQWHPGSVWIDDDLRLTNHKPAEEGCYCSDCLALFSAKEGKNYTREELVSAFEKDPALHERWNAFSQESLILVAETIAKAFHEISPETRLGLQHGNNSERNIVLKTLQRVTGKRSCSRPGGGAYSDHNPYEIVSKGIMMALLQQEQPGYDVLDQVCPEIESCPRTFCCKTAQGHRVESLLYSALGMDSLSYFIMDPLYESPEWYGKELLAPLAAEAECYKKFLKHNEDTLPSGMGLTGPAENMWDIDEKGLPLIGIASAGACRNADFLMITEKAVRMLSPEELEKALSGNVILDGAAAEALQEKGLEKRIEGVKTVKVNDFLFDFYTDDPVNEGHTSPSHYPLSDRKFRFEVPEGKKERIVSRYLDHKGADFGKATVLLERADSTRIALIGYDGFFTKFLSSSRVRMLNRIADYLAHGKLCALPEDPVQCMIVPRVRRDQTLASVTILNTVIGKQKPFRLQLRNVPAGAVQTVWHVPAAKEVVLPLERCGEKVFVTVPEIAAWDIGWLEF